MHCRYLILLLLSVSLTLVALAPPPVEHAWQQEWTTLFNGSDLSGWDTYLGPPADSTGQRLNAPAIGLNKDPNHVFTVVDKSIRISGQDVGAVITRRQYEDYHLQLQFRWGTLTWGQKKNKKKDSGLLYHSIGPYGADFDAWMRSQEFQVQEGDCGDYWGCAGGMARIPVIKKDSMYEYSPGGEWYTFRNDNSIGRHCVKRGDAEKPSGQWNTLDLYCHGDTSVHVVNGKVMMVLYSNGQADHDKVHPLTKGRIQLQSEGAEVYYRNIRIQPINSLPHSLLQ